MLIDNCYEHKLHATGVQLTTNHQADTQVQDTIEVLTEATAALNDSPLASKVELPAEGFNTGFLAMKYTGTFSDYASDQKKVNRDLGKWKAKISPRGLGARYLYSLDLEEREKLITKFLKEYIEDLDGEST